MPHKQSPDGYLSVTEVLALSIPKPYLCLWYGKLGTQKCEQIKRDSQELGTLVHNEIELKFQNPKILDPLNANASRMIKNFWSKFVIPYEVKHKELEITLKDKKLKLQGTFDAIIETTKGLVIADWKTSNQIDKQSVPLQLSMYNYLHGQNIDKGVIVRIDKESDAVQIVWYDDLPQYEKIWKSCIKVARWNKFGKE